MKKRVIIKMVSMFFLLALTTACQKTPSYDIESSYGISDVLNSRSQVDLLGTVITISMYDNAPTEVFDVCFDALMDIDNRMSVNKPDSEISLLNNSGQAVLSADLYGLIGKAKDFSQRSKGAFDITINPVMCEWKIETEFVRLPTQSEIDEALVLVGYESMHLLEQRQIQFEKPGMSIDLGAIAKGYACDVVVGILKEKGVKYALLDFGGNIYAQGKKPDGSPWRVGIRNPQTGADGYICTVEVIDKAVVTSGGYERQFERDGVFYHHILNPKTGYPVDNELLSVTIVAPNATEADALSTACFVLGLSGGVELLDIMPGYEGIFVTKQSGIYITDGLAENVKITDNQYSEAPRE